MRRPMVGVLLLYAAGVILGRLWVPPLPWLFLATAIALAAGFTSTVATLPPSDGRRWWKVLATDTFDAWVIDWPTDTSVDPHDHGPHYAVPMAHHRP